MPRPSKHVSPETLGGRIRAAREQLQLSLAEVADGHYSTSLLSQIERNKVEPSEESLRFLADRLHIPFADLQALAQQHRSMESEAYQYKSCEELRIEAQQYLAGKDLAQAISLFTRPVLARAPNFASLASCRATRALLL
jgi:transcriptional regulator with XRE-family HTH domain